MFLAHNGAMKSATKIVILAQIFNRSSIGQRILSQPQLNLNSTQKLDVTWKWLQSAHHPHKLNVSNISVVTYLSSTKLKLGSWDEQ